MFFSPSLPVQLKQLGHSVDKVEYIVMVGTFMALDDDYKDFFIRNLHDALQAAQCRRLLSKSPHLLPLPPHQGTTHLLPYGAPLLLAN